MSRSFALERVRIQIEIVLESIGDFMLNSADKLRRPLLVLAGIALVLTMRSARKGVKTMKPGLTSSAHDLSNYRPSASSLSTSLGTITGLGGGGSSSSSSGGSYGFTSSTSYGVSSGTFGRPSTSSGALRSSASSTGPSRATAELVDIHGSTARVMDAAPFKDFGGIAEFYGQIETLSAFEGAGVVDKVLQSPGAGKILVVDGSGNTQSAIFDAKAAMNAQQNGWKGVIINGVVRNAESLSTMRIGIKALGTSPMKGRASSGSKGGALTIGGMNFSPGDHVYCDKDGILVSDRELNMDASQSGSISFGATETTTTPASTTSTGSMGIPGGSAGGASASVPSLSAYQRGGYNTGGATNGMFGSDGQEMQAKAPYSGSKSGSVPGYGSASDQVASSGYGSAAGYGSTQQLTSSNSYQYNGAGGSSYPSDGSPYAYSASLPLYRHVGWLGAVSIGGLSAVLTLTTACL